MWYSSAVAEIEPGSQRNGPEKECGSTLDKPNAVCYTIGPVGNDMSRLSDEADGYKRTLSSDAPVASSLFFRSRSPHLTN